MARFGRGFPVPIQQIQVRAAAAVDATATPGVVAATTTIGAGTFTSAATVVASTVAAVASIGAPTIAAGAKPLPGTVAGTTTISATVSTGSKATPSTVAAVASVGAPTVGQGANVAPATVAGTTTITAPFTDTTPPSVPTNLAVTAYGETTLDLSWTASTDNVAVTQYEIRILPGPATDPRGEPLTVAGPIKGTQIGAWDTDGGLLKTSTGGRALMQAAGTKLVRLQMWRTPSDLGGTQTTADFNSLLDTARNLASRYTDAYRNGYGNAILMIGLPPIWNEQYPGQPDPWSLAWQKWMIDKTVAALGTAAATDVIFEMGNEPDNYGTLTAQQYYDTLWKVNVPQLKAYARFTYGIDIKVGGPAWANSYAANLTDIQTWLTDCKNDIGTYGLDIVPDFVSTHCYLVTPTENDTVPHAQARIDQWATFYRDLRTAIRTTFSGLTDRGYPITEQIKTVCSEYQYTIDNANTQDTDQVWTDHYMRAMHDMFKAAGVWASVEFTAASHTGGALDLLTTSGTAKPLYSSFAAQ